MDKKRQEIKIKLAENAVGQNISPDSIVVPVESELKIMKEELGSKGRQINGLGAYPLMEPKLSVGSTSHALLNRLNELESHVLGMAEENEALKAENEKLKAQASNKLIRGRGSNRSFRARGSGRSIA